MKNFFVIFSFVFVLALVSTIGSQSVTKILDGEKSSKAIEAYPATNLGFVLEKRVSNAISYKQDNLVVGECVFLKAGREDINRIADKLGLFITNKYELDGKLIIEGVSNKVPYFIEGRQANIQMSVAGNETIVGSPIIYGSY